MDLEILRYVNAALDAYALVIVLIVIVAILLSRVRAEKLNRVFLSLCLVVALILVGDAGTWLFDGLGRPWYPLAARLANLLLYIGSFLSLYFFTLYVTLRLEHAGRKLKRPQQLAWAVSVLGIVLLAVSQFTGWLYYFDQMNIYHRGPLYLLTQIILLLIMLMNLGLVLYSRKALPNGECAVLLLYGAIPLAASALQTMCYGISITGLASVISALMAYMGIQSRAMAGMRILSERDSLTDLFNRTALKRFRQSIYRKLDSCGVIWFDINNLKLTNDSDGHTVGDQIICQAADGIRSITSRQVHGYRMGGDEFMVIACNVPQTEMAELERLWRVRMEVLNQNSQRHCVIAVGSAWSQAPFDLDELIRQADQDMYRNKRGDPTS